MLHSLKRKSRRSVRRAGLLAGAAVVALGIGGVTAGGAAAAPSCTGSNIIGEGASLQKVAQINVWTQKFCGGGKVEYKPEGSGAGLAAWDFNGPDAKPFDTTRSFVASDDAPTTTQIANAKTAAGGATDVLVIPVAQTAIGVAVNPPAGCDVEEITNQQLESIFRGNVKTWGKIDTAFGAGCTGAAITRVVRFDGSGTTYQFKNYLASVNSAKLACTEPSRNWSELRPIETGSNPNTTWPENGKGGCAAGTLSSVVTAGANGGGALVKKVNTTDGSIGYAALPDIEANREEGVTHWAKLQNNGLVKLSKATFAEPGIESGQSANCNNAKYTVPANGRVGSGTGIAVDWSQVFGANNKIGGEDYPLCTITYDMSLTKFGSVSTVPGGATFTEGQFVTAKDYLKEYVTAEAGQTDIATAEKWYAALPSSVLPANDVLGSARLSASKIGF
jgi:ABC-type phosphate transport system substrate-binding protein